jgi:hypothetical protein
MVNPMSESDQRIHIWIITPEGEVLIRKFSQNHEPLRLNDITIESHDLCSAINLVENKTNILCSKDDLQAAYCLEITSEHINVNGFALSLKLDDQHKELIEEKYKGEFVDYKDLPTLFKEKNIDLNIKEAMYSLVAWLDQKQTFYPSL